MRSAITFLISFIFLIPTGDISMLGIKINHTRKSLDSLKLEIVANENNMIKYTTNNGNDFSVTIENNKVVYMENDWLQDPKGEKPLFSDFVFGQTTLKDIRKKFSTNGFTYRSRGAFTTKNDLIEFNCFEFDSSNNEVLVTITKVSLKEDVTEKTIAAKLKLDALIIADKSYLDRTWGEEKVYDENYKKIKP
ncbi:MAG TPA: hypothetical protein VK590_07285 [Saprospiraceae bacterium]|nr:hypothetical protein [Saprospiraceae bacterium]